MGPNEGWPEHFRCRCTGGELWWDRMQARYRCGQCSAIMVLDDSVSGLIATWVSGSKGNPKLTRDQARARAAKQVALITLG